MGITQDYDPTGAYDANAAAYGWDDDGDDNLPQYYPDSWQGYGAEPYSFASDEIFEEPTTRGIKPKASPGFFAKLFGCCGPKAVTKEKKAKDVEEDAEEEDEGEEDEEEEYEEEEE